MKPETYVGYGTIKYLAEILPRYDTQKIFLITGNRSFSSSGAEALLKPYLVSYEVHRFFEFSANPNFEDLKRGIELFQRHRPDLILAIGGGSAIDIAKLINVYAAGEIDLEKQVHEFKELKAGNPMIAIPTTAGTGSEVTQFATLYIKNRKHSVSHEALLPDVAIVDPALTRNLPARITAISGMDAISQAIESYWSIHSTNHSKSYAREAIRAIRDQLPEAVHRATDSSRLAMAEASYLAGKAINITRTTAPHALSYALTSRFGVPHGQAVSFMLPSFIVFNYGVDEADLADRRGVDYVRKTLEEIAQYLGCKTVPDASAEVRRIMRDIGLATTFAELQVDKEKAITTVLDEINVERLVNNPRRATVSRMKELLETIEN